ncbi:MAG: N-glycosylase/DNA lyase [Candidatus Absconditabacteria bacterium]|nr:N-glycosylase/DNA lyase [Candidatus Absconditabacteria bacterium]
MLTELISSYSFEEIVAIEKSDRQFLALKSAWELIKNRNFGGVDDKVVKEVFLRAVIYNSLISYQIAGSGELRWEEFADRLKSDFDVLLLDFIQGKTSFDRWYNLMITSKNNKRLYNIKVARLKKLSQFSLKSMDGYYDNMIDLWQDLGKAMGVPIWSKTICFAVKMFGYAARVVFEKFIPYPLEVAIPVDSRIRKLFLTSYGPVSDKEIIEKTYELSKISSVPSLHLDSLFWVKR